MIFFLEDGQLGNQLFQYCGFRQYFPEHKLLFLGCDDLQRTFQCNEARFVSKAALDRLLPFGILKRIVFFLVAARILGRIQECDEKIFQLVLRKGLLWNIYVPQNVFFQHGDVINQIQFTLHLKPHLIKLAHDWIRKREIDISLVLLVFVHVRRSDYMIWPSKEFPAILDLVWYKRAMETIKKQVSNPVFILMGDDLFYLRDVFEESNNLFISSNMPEIDLAMMSICHSGILSASTFAWWGAFLAQSKRNFDGKFIAPLYWGGHRARTWYPKSFSTNWLTYEE